MIVGMEEKLGSHCNRGNAGAPWILFMSLCHFSLTNRAVNRARPTSRDDLCDMESMRENSCSPAGSLGP